MNMFWFILSESALLKICFYYERKCTFKGFVFWLFDTLFQFKPLCLLFQRQKADEEARKQHEIEGLQKQLQQLKDMASGKAVSTF